MLPTVVDPQNSQQACDRMLDAIAAVFLSLKKRPVIRYERSSEIARRVAQDAAVSVSGRWIV
jgi:vacuolar protein sorting-associated protein 45